MKKISKQNTVSLMLLTLFLVVVLYLFCPKVAAASEYQYLIKVNKQQNCVTIYEKDEKGKYTVPVKAMVCSSGSATPVGTYNTQCKYRWKILLEDVWGQYSTRITGNILFHSVWYYKQDPSTLSARQYNNLGVTCSHGCVRLTVEDAKWIYDHCPVGTTVQIYNSKDPGPLGKPTAVKLKAGTGWDPTDPAKENPFHSEKPIILGADDHSIEWGSHFDALAGISASSAKGVDLTKKIKVTGTVDTQKAGRYKIQYSVKDSNKNKTKLDVVITVKECLYEVKLKGVKDRVIPANTTVDKDYCLKGVTAYYHNEKLNKSDISVVIKEKDGSYQVTYKATYKNGQTSKKTVEYMVDQEAPVLKVAHVTFKGDPEINRKYVLKNVSVSDNDTKLKVSDIKTDIEEIFDGGYLVTYKVSDSAGNTTKETVQFTREENLMIHGVHNVTVPSGQMVNKDYVMKDVTGTDGDLDATSQIEVTIMEPKNNVYQVVYHLETETEFMEITAFYTVIK